MDTKNRQSNNFKKRCPLLTARSMDQPTQCIRATTSFSFFLFWGFSKIASESEAERASTVGNALPYATRWRRLFSELPSLAPADLQTAAKSQYIAVLQNSQWNNMNGYTSMWFFKSSRKNLAASHVDLAELHHLGSSLAWNRLQGSSRIFKGWFKGKVGTSQNVGPCLQALQGLWVEQLVRLVRPVRPGKLEKLTLPASASFFSSFPSPPAVHGGPKKVWILCKWVDSSCHCKWSWELSFRHGSQQT